MSFDRALELIIAVGVWIGVWLEWQTLQERRRIKIKRIVTTLLRNLVRAN